METTSVSKISPEKSKPLGPILSDCVLALHYLGVQVDPVCVLAGAELQARVERVGIHFVVAVVVRAPFWL